MTQATLDYNGGLVLYLPPGQTDGFLRGSFYKLSLRRYAAGTENGRIVFKSALNYLDYKKIISLFRQNAERNDLTLSVSPALAAFIESQEIYVEERSRLGMEIKNQDAKLRDRFDIYRQAVDAAMVRRLRPRQMWDSFFMCAMRKSANFSVPGSGKTASVLGMYAYLKLKELVKRIVVVCPKNAFGSWIDEFTACFGDREPLRLLNIHAPTYKTTADRRRALLYDAGPCNLILVNYESVGGVLDALKKLTATDALLVFDEVHKVKRVDGEYARSCLDLARTAGYTVAMTGTPIPNTYLDIYNLLHLLFPNEYDTFFDFSPAMLRRADAADVQEINDKLQPFFCRTTKEQLGVPPANEDAVFQMAASENENRILKILQMKYRKNKLALLIRILQLESNPKALLHSLNLRDFAYLLDDNLPEEEIDFADYSKEIQALINSSGTPTKFAQCVALAEDLASQGKPVIIWCIFIESIDRLSKALEDAGIPTRRVYGEVPLEERLQILEDFRAGRFRVLLTNPHTLAESVSLHSVCHDAIYFEYSYNLVHLLQSKDRIHRLGLPEGQYTQYDYLQLIYQTEDGPWSMDEAVYQRLREKEQTMLDAIDRHVLETMPTSQEDLDLIFKKLF